MSNMESHSMTPPDGQLNETPIETAQTPVDPKVESTALTSPEPKTYGFQKGNKWAIKPGEARNPLGSRARKLNQMDRWMTELEEMDDSKQTPRIFEIFENMYKLASGKVKATGRDQVEAARFLIEHSYGNAPKEIDVNTNVRVVQVSIPALTDGQKPKTQITAITPEFDDDGYEVTPRG